MLRPGSVFPEPAERFLDEYKEQAGAVVDARHGNAGKWLAGQESGGACAAMLDFGHANLKRTFLG